MSKATGRSTRRAKAQNRQLKAQGGPCVICGQAIDYALAYPHPQSFSKQHIKALALHPELAEDPANLGPAHLVCNQSAGMKATPVGALGPPSKEQ